MTVEELLKTKDRDPITVVESTIVREAMDLLLDNKISCLLVIDSENSLSGIISDKDIFKKAHQDPGGFQDAKVGELMSRNLIVGLATDKISYIGGIMTKNRIRHVPIVDNKKLVGLVSVGDVVKCQIENMEIENRYLKQYIDGSYPG